ncbi:CHAT domain-containing protein [Halomicronema hongdechloris]|nr:CHAT domain-containing protein [Halomicronema hongdechloris]
MEPATICHQVLAGWLQQADAYPRSLPVGQRLPQLALLQQALSLANLLQEPELSIEVLHRLADLSHDLGQYPRAIEQFQQALELAQSLDLPRLQGESLAGLGRVHTDFGQLALALEYYQQALEQFQAVGATAEVAATWRLISIAHQEDGQWLAALQAAAESLAMAQGDRGSGGSSGGSTPTGEVELAQGEYDHAIASYRQAIARRRQGADSLALAESLNRLGGAYSLQGQYPEALGAYREALDLSRQQDNLAQTATLLQNLGLTQAKVGQINPAINRLHEAAAIFQVLGYRGLEGETLSTIATLLRQQQQPELAIAVYKRAINVLEGVRQELRLLPQELQTIFPETFAGTYRALADLLLQQGRIEEAQQVLDLLKVQEIDDYLYAVEASGQGELGIESLSAETALLDRYGQTIAQGRELAQLRHIPPPERSPAQQQRIAELVAAQQDSLDSFNRFITSPEVTALIQQLSMTSRRQNIDPAHLNSLQDNLRQLEVPAVLLYPLILEDRLELLLVTPYSPPIRRTVAVTAGELTTTIQAFRAALSNREPRVEELAHRLYRWLVQPLEADLAQAEAELLVYAPDGQLRYIPLAALHDGRQWLVERFQVTNITAASLTDFDAAPAASPSVLAAAFSQGQYDVHIGQRRVQLAGLPYAGVEVDSLTHTFATVSTLLNQDFSPTATIPRMGDHTIVHLATHAEFVPGQPQDSFILFGNGEQVTLEDIGTWNLNRADLVVLSACQTGLGGRLGNGEEILGFGYQIQRAGAKAAVASLWSVDDGGTQALMTAFYAGLQQGSTKAHALRQAQLALIRNDQAVIDDTQRSIAIVLSDGATRQLPSSFSHPYYWAPFILIGNGR